MDEPKPKSGLRKLKKKVSRAFNLSRSSSNSQSGSAKGSLAEQEASPSARTNSLLSGLELIRDGETVMGDPAFSSPGSGHRTAYEDAASEGRLSEGIPSSATQAELERLRTENSKLLEKLATAHSSLSALEESSVELQSRAHVGQEMSNATNKVLLELTEQLSHEAMQKAALEVQLAEKDIELRTLQEGIHATETALQEEANEEIFRAQERLAGTLASLTASQEREAALRLELELANDQLEASGVTQRALLAAADSQAQETAVELTKVLHDLEEAVRARDKISIELTRLREETEEREAVFKADAMRATVEAEALLERLKADREGVVAELSSLRAEFEAYRTKSEAAHAALHAQLEETAREAEAALEELQAEASAELEAIQGKLEAAEDTGSKLLRQLAAATATKETTALQLTKSTKELEVLRPKAADLTAQIERLTLAAREHETQMSSVLAELQAAKAASASTQSRLDEVREALRRESEALRSVRRDLERSEAEAREESAGRKRAEAAHATGLLEIIELTAARDGMIEESAALRRRAEESEKSAREAAAGLAQVVAEKSVMEQELRMLQERMSHMLGEDGVFLSPDGNNLGGIPEEELSAESLRIGAGEPSATAGGESTTEEEEEEELIEEEKGEEFSIQAVRPAGSGLSHRLPPLPLSARLHIRNKMVLGGLPGKHNEDVDELADDEEAETMAVGSLQGRSKRRHDKNGHGNALIQTGLKVAVSLGMAALGAALTLHGAEKAPNPKDNNKDRKVSRPPSVRA